MNDFEPNWEYLGEPLGAGGQAQTYLVRERAQPNRKGAAKRLSDLSRESRFRQEIEAYKRIDHPNVLKILDEGTGSKGRPYLVSEYCEMGELTTEKLDGLTLLERLRFFRKICNGVAEAHRKGIVHRDIKPENILLKVGLAPVVGDFGICFLTDREPGSSRLTEPYRVMASRWFGAPEAKNGRVNEVKLSADIYSLGKLLYWIIRGEIFEREEHRTPRYALNQEESLDPSFELISRLLDRTVTESPGERIQSAPDLIPEVDQLIDVIEAGGHAIGIDVRHRCIFCARGRYVVMVDEVTGPPAGSRSEAVHFGLTFYDSSHRARPLIMVCDYCGNVQMFRPDLPHPRPGSGFDQNLQKEKIARWGHKPPTGK